MTQNPDWSRIKQVWSMSKAEVNIFFEFVSLKKNAITTWIIQLVNAASKSELLKKREKCTKLGLDIKIRIGNQEEIISILCSEMFKAYL